MFGNRTPDIDAAGGPAPISICATPYLVVIEHNRTDRFSRGEVLPNQLIRWSCVDRLTSHDLSVVGPVGRRSWISPTRSRLDSRRDFRASRCENRIHFRLRNLHQATNDVGVKLRSARREQPADSFLKGKALPVGP